MEYLRPLFVFLVLLLGLPMSIRGQCDGAARKITGGDGEIRSPNLDNGGEYNKSANCIWEFSPSSSGKEYVLRMTVKKLKLYLLKNQKKYCVGSYNLTLNQVPTKCDRFADRVIDWDGSPVILEYCRAYYTSLSCGNTSQIQECETQQQTSFPVPVTYFSDGRTDPDVASWPMHFRIEYEFIECPTEAAATQTTTRYFTAATTRKQEPTINQVTTDEAAAQNQTLRNRESTIATSPTDAAPTEKATATEAPATSSTPASTIVLAIVVVIQTLLIIVGVTRYVLWKRKLLKPLTNNIKPQELRDGIYDNDPSSANQQNRAYEEIPEKTAYEVIGAKNKRPYLTPSLTQNCEGEYEVPIPSNPYQNENADV